MDRLKLIVLMAFLVASCTSAAPGPVHANGGFMWLEAGFSQELAIAPAGDITSIVFFNDGDYLIANPRDGRIFRIDPTEHRGLNQVTALGSFHAWVWGLTWGKDGRLYATLPAFGLLRELDSETGGLIRNVVSNLAAPTALTVDPVTGDLIVVESGQKRLLRVNPQTGLTSVLSDDPLLVDPRAILFSQDGSQVFVANGSHQDGGMGQNVVAIDRAGDAYVLASLTGSATGLVLGGRGTPLDHLLLVNRGDGGVDQIDLVTKAVRPFATGGVGGTLAAVDAHNDLYFIRGDGIIKVTPEYGHPSLGMNQPIRQPTLTTDTTWSAAQSPRTITEDLVVAPGVTLTVQPGVVIQFAARASLDVYGTLRVLGTDTAPVRFTSAASSPHAGDWGFLRIHSGAGTGYLGHTIIEYAGNTERNADGALVLHAGTTTTLSDVVIQHNAASGLTLYDATATVSDSTLRFNRSGVMRTRYDPFVSSGGGVRSINSMLTIVRSSINDNIAANLPGDPTSGGDGQAGGLAVQGGSVTVLQSVIEGNMATYSGGGIGAIGGRLVVRESIIRGNSINCTGSRFCYGGGISLNSTPGEVSGTLIEANTAVGGSGGGISSGGGYRPVIAIKNNRIVRNRAASGAGAIFGSEQSFERNIVTENQTTESGLLAAAVIASGDVGSAPIRCNTIAYNRAPGASDPAGVAALTVRPVQENLIYGNTGYQLAPLLPPSYVPSTDLDATKNWWGTLDGSKIAADVLDRNDRSTLPSVHVDPFATIPPACAPSLDSRPPTITNSTLLPNSAALGTTVSLRVMIDDSQTGSSPIDMVEYFIGEDPGVAQARRMGAADGTFDQPIEEARITIDTTLLGNGVFPIGVRGMDRAGNWTRLENTYLVIYDPRSGYATGAGGVIPGGATSDPGDHLPGLDGRSRASFGFAIRYKQGTSMVPDGNLQFHYTVGDFHLRSSSMEWLVVTNTNWAKFQGLAAIDGATGSYPFRVDARDGDAGGTSQPDRFIIRIYAPGSDPNVAEPIYKASSDLVGGQIKIHR